MVTVSATSKKQPRFSTILAWRGEDNQSSDLEFGLRSHCQRLIVKRTPLSGAHLLMTSERIAVRAYYPCDLQELMEEEQQTKRQTKAPCDTDDFDGLSSFLSSFQLALILFVMTTPSTMIHDDDDSIAQQQQQQLENMNSHFHRAQRLSVRHQQEAEEEAITTNKDHTNRNHKSPTKIQKQQNNNRKSCVLLLPDTQSAIETLIAVADSVTLERKASKRVFFKRLETQFFLPSFPRHDARGVSCSASASTTATATTILPSAAANAAASTHVAGGLREIARAFELPPGEADILMSELGDLKTIATADDSLLTTIPVDLRTRKILHRFFGSSEGRQRNGTNTGKRQHQQETTLLLQQQQQQQHHPDLHSLTSTAKQLFPQSNSSPSSTFLTPNSPHGRPLESSAHPFQAKQHVPQTRPMQQQQEHSFDPSMADESWMEPNEVQDSYIASFYSEDNVIPDIDKTFDIRNVQTNIISNGNTGPMLLPTSAAKGKYPIAGGDQFFGIHRRDSRFPAMYPSDTLSLGPGYTINPYVTPGGQPYQDDIRFHQHQMPQKPPVQHPYQYPVEQQPFPSHFSQSHSLIYQNVIKPPANNIYHYGPPGLLFSSSRQREHQRQPQHQPQHQRQNQNQQRPYQNQNQQSHYQDQYFPRKRISEINGRRRRQSSRF